MLLSIMNKINESRNSGWNYFIILIVFFISAQTLENIWGLVAYLSIWGANNWYCDKVKSDKQRILDEKLYQENLRSQKHDISRAS